VLECTGLSLSAPGPHRRSLQVDGVSARLGHAAGQHRWLDVATGVRIAARALVAATAACCAATAFLSLRAPLVAAMRLDTATLAYARPYWLLRGACIPLQLSSEAFMTPRASLTSSRASSLALPLALHSAALQEAAGLAPDALAPSSALPSSGELDERGAAGWASELRSYLRDGSNMLVRSTLLQSTFVVVTVCVSRMGASALAAHQVVHCRCCC
jgi:hypothetical protein